MRTANLAILFTEIAGFSERTSQQTLEQHQRLLQVYSGLLVPLFRAFGGRVVKSIGESFLVTFGSPTQAVLCGVAIQERLWQHNRSVSEPEQFTLRVAVNLGEVRLESGDIFGEPVNIAARVVGLSPPGEVYFTEAIYLAMNKAEVPAGEVGAFELKGIPGRIRVFQVPRATDAMQAAAPAAPAEEEAPPFGNLGLARVPEKARMADRAVALGSHALQRATAALAQLTASRRQLVVRIVAGLAALALLAGVVAVLSKSEVDAAIDDVARAPEAEKKAKARIARKLISEEKSAPDAAYDGGRLEEALGNTARALSSYETAARAGHRKAGSRLIELLDSPACDVRRDAARTLGNLKLERARGALESLAKQGGPGESEVPLLGCDSRKAAEEALRRLE